ncbi:hypothetical protein H310_14029 [Aphanomyces invadans]|uniref:Uncharacterized protein n=1 Tax=Aphanomyces invadans TaxID=157072 RepID=A0A024TBF1_9STRA|nr:hypothetical protein H310_14029 [Aphanomyces invadans]ETV91339.1 hypothetical protein H310_14029 [Aphanomyces invadans]|eukprot:XP_008879967.1 hypothetical protein H310_14029 [Aphanomyces invadans]
MLSGGSPAPSWQLVSMGGTTLVHNLGLKGPAIAQPEFLNAILPSYHSWICQEWHGSRHGHRFIRASCCLDADGSVQTGDGSGGQEKELKGTRTGGRGQAGGGGRNTNLEHCRFRRESSVSREVRVRWPCRTELTEEAEARAENEAPCRSPDATCFEVSRGRRNCVGAWSRHWVRWEWPCRSEASTRQLCRLLVLS